MNIRMVVVSPPSSPMDARNIKCTTGALLVLRDRRKENITWKERRGEEVWLSDSNSPYCNAYPARTSPFELPSKPLYYQLWMKIKDKMKIGR